MQFTFQPLDVVWALQIPNLTFAGFNTVKHILCHKPRPIFQQVGHRLADEMTEWQSWFVRGVRDPTVVSLHWKMDGWISTGSVCLCFQSSSRFKHWHLPLSYSPMILLWPMTPSMLIKVSRLICLKKWRQLFASDHHVDQARLVFVWTPFFRTRYAFPSKISNTYLVKTTCKIHFFTNNKLSCS